MQHINKDAFVTETNLLFVKFRDYLLTVESSMEELKRSGMQQFVSTFGKSRPAKRIINAHRKRFENDFARFCRYSALTSLFSLFEVRSHRFIKDFDQTYPGKPNFKTLDKKIGFVRQFRLWLETPPNPIVLPYPRLWAHMVDFQIIRNCITHAHGDCALVKDSTRIKEVVRRTRKVRFDENNILVVDTGFPFAVCDKIHQLFRILFRQAGYGLALPPGFLESFQKHFAGHEQEMAETISRFDKTQTINLGGEF
jgi:hypothetical protein